MKQFGDKADVVGGRLGSFRNSADLPECAVGAVGEPSSCVEQGVRTELTVGAGQTVDDECRSGGVGGEPHDVQQVGALFRNPSVHHGLQFHRDQCGWLGHEYPDLRRTLGCEGHHSGGDRGLGVSEDVQSVGGVLGQWL